MRWTTPVLKMRRQEAIKLLDLPIDTRVFEPKDTVFYKYILLQFLFGIQMLFIYLKTLLENLVRLSQSNHRLNNKTRPSVGGW